MIKNAVLVAVGDELLSGARTEKNASFMARHLHNKGINVLKIEVIPDTDIAIHDVLSEWIGKTELLVLSGGLGPTHDDRTRHAIAKYLGCTLRADDKLYDKVLARVKDNPSRYAYTEKCRNPQALIPEKANAVYNPAGFALGIRFTRNKTTVIALPGVPMEYEAMIRQELPEIFAPDAEHCHSSVIILGIPELAIAEQIPEVINNPELHVSILPAFPQVELIIRGAGKLVSEAERLTRSRFSADVLPQGCSSLAEAVLYEARCRGVKISCAESCTGGMIGAALTDIAGSSDVFSGSAVTYSNEAKNNILGVKNETLENFGAVSEQCACEMAIGALRIFGADYAVSVTGIAGPDGGSDAKPVGTVWFGFASGNEVRAIKKRLPGKRAEIRRRTVNFALSELWRMLHNG